MVSGLDFTRHQYAWYSDQLQNPEAPTELSQLVTDDDVERVRSLFGIPHNVKLIDVSDEDLGTHVFLVRAASERSSAYNITF